MRIVSIAHILFGEVKATLYIAMAILLVKTLGLIGVVSFIVCGGHN